MTKKRFLTKDLLQIQRRRIQERQRSEDEDGIGRRRDTKTELISEVVNVFRSSVGHSIDKMGVYVSQWFRTVRTKAL